MLFKYGKLIVNFYMFTIFFYVNTLPLGEDGDKRI